MIDTIDPICNPPSLGSTISIAPLTSKTFDLNSFESFLCEVMKIATKNEGNQVLYEPKEYDYASTVLNFASLTAVGDPRISLGYTLSAVYHEFFPKAVAELEIKRSGGCQIVNGYVCDADGRKLKQATEVCPQNYNEDPITSQTIIKRTAEYVKAAMDTHAKNFSDYIKSLRTQGWVDTLHVYANFPIFYVKLTKASSTKGLYYKYYYDVKEVVAKYLGKPISVRTDNGFDNQDHINAVIYVTSIPDY